VASLIARGCEEILTPINAIRPNRLFNLALVAIVSFTTALSSKVYSQVKARSASLCVLREALENLIGLKGGRYDQVVTHPGKKING
jgi:hypothetical protein